MKFADFLDTLAPGRCDRLLQSLAKLAEAAGVHKLFYDNLLAEEQPSAEVWEKFLSFLESVQQEEFAYQVTQHIRENSSRYQLQGNCDPDSVVESLARLISLKSLVDLVVEQDPRGMSPSQAVEYLRSRIIGLPSSSFPEWFCKLKLGHYILWAAIGLQAPNDYLTAKIHACRCGLPIEIEDGPIVCLRFKMPAGGVAYAPTLFDAYGGWPWPAHFRVGSRVGVVFAGRTKPRPDCSTYAGFREVVCSPVSFLCLCEPITMTENTGG